MLWLTFYRSQHHWTTKLFSFDLQTSIPVCGAGWKTLKERHCKRKESREAHPQALAELPSSLRLCVPGCSCSAWQTISTPEPWPFVDQTEISCSGGHSFICGFTKHAAEPCWHWNSLLWTNLNYWNENKTVLNTCQVSWGQKFVYHFEQCWELLISRNCSNTQLLLEPRCTSATVVFQNCSWKLVQTCREAEHEHLHSQAASAQLIK